MYLVMYIGREMIRYSHLLESHFENASFYTRMLINVSSRANVLVLDETAKWKTVTGLSCIQTIFLYDISRHIGEYRVRTLIN